MAKKTVALQKRNASDLESIRKDILQHRNNIHPRFTSSRMVTPPVDVIESNDKITVIADMPGIEKDDLTVAVEKDVLTIGGYRDVPHPKNFNWDDLDPEYERIRYHREFRLGGGIQKEQVDALYMNGVLRVILPKTEDARPKRIEIKEE